MDLRTRQLEPEELLIFISCMILDRGLDHMLALTDLRKVWNMDSQWEPRSFVVE